MGDRKRYTVSWESVERRYKKQFDTLEAAKAHFQKVLKYNRVRFVNLTDNADLLRPITILSALTARINRPY